ncbi:serine hydrolase domain-containing protein [Terrilactibacillus laevilacticus]|nr:serine hydrolase [Terrilactibacillus laevilacticus]
MLRQIAENMLNKGIEENIFPGAVTNIQVGNYIDISSSSGLLSCRQNAKPTQLDSLYDIASLTKIVATLPMILLTIQSKKLSLNDRVVNYFPELEKNINDKRFKDITIFHLLTHSSGLPGWRPYFIKIHGSENYKKMIFQEPLIYSVGEKIVYSDIGFMLLGFILERIWDTPLNILVREKIFKPLDMNQTGYRPLNFNNNIATTESNNEFEKNMAVNYVDKLITNKLPQNAFSISTKEINDYKWRTGDIHGVVHDSNTYYGLNGVSGHAGLFSNIEDLKKYILLWKDIDNNPFIDSKLLHFATRCHANYMSIKRGLGFEKSHSGTHCSSGQYISKEAFGHTGFTGTSIWCDPFLDTTIIVLTNRVHPKVNPNINQWRMTYHNSVVSEIVNQRKDGVFY